MLYVGRKMVDRTEVAKIEGVKKVVVVVVVGASLCLHRVIIPFKVIDLVLMCFGINIYQLSILTITHHLYFILYR